MGYLEAKAKTTTFELVVFVLEEMIWDCVDAVEIPGVDVWIVFVLLTGRIICDVNELILEVIVVPNSVFVVSTVPDFSGCLLTCSEGVAALDVLNALCCRFVYDGCNQNVDVIGHDDETVQFKALSVPLLEEH